jgi:hypothetical protein
MNKPALVGYGNLDEFRRDFEIFKMNPNDKVFRNAVNMRVRMSPRELQVEISEEITTALMESNPREFIRRVSKQLPPDCWMIIKSENDPFFEA